MIRAILNFFVEVFSYWPRNWPTLEELPAFKPCVIFHQEGNFTEIVLEDTGTYYEYLPGGSGVCLGYSFDGRLIAIRVYGDVTSKPRKSAA